MDGTPLHLEWRERVKKGEVPGPVAEGYKADLLLLSGDPLADIGNLKTIVGVVSNGRWFSAQQLAKMKSARE